MEFYEARTAVNDNPNQEIEYTESWLKAQWSYFNKKFFGGKLKSCQLVWKHSSKSYGYCSYDYNFDKNRIETTEIMINDRKIYKYADFKDTLVHEMVHQWAAESVNKDRIKMANAYGKARSRKWWHALAIGGKDGHSAEWRSKCDELLAQDKTLILTKYAINSEVAKATGKKKKELMKQTESLHILVHDKGKKRCYVYTDERYKKLLQRIEEGNEQGEWFEYSFDNEKAALSDVKPNEPGYHYQMNWFKEMCNNDVIDQYSEKKLGGSHVESTRSRRSRMRRSLWGF